MEMPSRFHSKASTCPFFRFGPRHSWHHRLPIGGLRHLLPLLDRKGEKAIVVVRALAAPFTYRRAMRRDGATYRVIGAAVGLRYKTVAHILKRSPAGA